MVADGRFESACGAAAPRIGDWAKLQAGGPDRVFDRFLLADLQRSTIVRVACQTVVEREPRWRPRSEKMAVGLEPRRVIE